MNFRSYKGESKVLQCFANVMHNSAAAIAFVVVMKVRKHAGLLDSKIAWYSPSATHHICLYGLEYEPYNTQF